MTLTLAVCGRLDVSGFQLFRKRRYSKKKIAGRLGAEAEPCTDRGQETTLSHPQSGGLPATLEVRQEGGAAPGRWAEARRPQRGGRRRALGRSPAVKLWGPFRWKVWGHCSLPSVLESLGGNEMADRVKPFRRTLPGESKTPSGESVSSQSWMLEFSKREKRLRRRARGVLAQKRAQSWGEGGAGRSGVSHVLLAEIFSAALGRVESSGSSSSCFIQYLFLSSVSNGPDW